MYDFLYYNLKVGGCLAVFYLFYKVLLSRETFHRFNRLLVLAALAGSFLLPLCVITVYEERPLSEPLPVLPELVAPDAEPLPETFPWELAAGVLYWVGTAVVALGSLLSLASVVRMIRSGRRMPLDGRIDLVLHEREMTPFSWMRYVVLSERDYRENGRGIIAHERAHVVLGHSFDLLVSDLLSCVQWFNPAMWLLRRELRAIHEYEADEAVLRSGADAREYQMLLIKKAAGERWYSVANSFNHSNLKNRITMMLRKRSSGWAGAKALFVLPLAGVALGAFAETVYLCPEDKDSKKMPTVQIEPAAAVETRPQAAPAAPGKVKTTWRLYDQTTGEPLVGVIVRQVGSKRGSVTDCEGLATLEVENGATLSFDLVGYRQVQLTASGLVDGTVMQVGLSKEEDESSAEVAVKGGVGTLMADALLLVDGEPVESLNAIEPSQIAAIDVLKGDAAVSYIKRYGDKAQKSVVVVKLRKDGAQGESDKCVGTHSVTITRTGADSVRVVRISRSDAASAETAAAGTILAPLYYVDGERLAEGKSIDEIPADRIASMEILKNDAAVQQYGAAPGQPVVLIRTKTKA